jgi:hypothetical protein
MGSISENHDDTALVPKTTALGLRDELAIAQEGLAKTKRDQRSNLAIIGGGLVGAVPGLLMVLGAVHPVTAVIGGLLFLSSYGASITAIRRLSKAGRSRGEARARIADIQGAIATEEQSRHLKQLKATAEAEFDRVLVTFDLRTGMEFPVTADGKTSQILRIEQADPREVFKDGGFLSVTSVTAQLYDAHTGDTGILELDQPVPHIPALKRTIVPSEKALPR